MQQIERADILRVGMDPLAANVSFPYHIDDQFIGAVRVTYPFSLDREDLSLLPSIGVGIATFMPSCV